MSTDSLHNWRRGDPIKAEWLNDITRAIAASIIGGPGINVARVGQNLTISLDTTSRVTMPRNRPARITAVNTSDPASTKYTVVCDQDTSIKLTNAVPWDRFAPSTLLNNRAVNDPCDIMIMRNKQHLLLAHETGKITDCSAAATATGPGPSFSPSGSLRMAVMLS